MKNATVRTLSGIVYLGILIGSLFLGKFAFGLVFLLICLLSMYEFYGLARASGSSPFLTPSLVAGGSLFVLAYLVCSGTLRPAMMFLVLPLVILILIGALYSRGPEVTRNAAVSCLGLLYIALPLSAVNLLAFPESNGFAFTHRVILGIFILVWINDTGAYLVGISLGKHRLFGRISPKKSWEGAIGGALLTLVCAWWIHRIVGMLERTDWMVIAAIVSVFGVYGDLTESLFKRDADRKDSGSIMPGHGGILDRIDSVLFVMPISLVYLILTNL